MTDIELDQIEKALGISLPAAYRELMNPFPIPAYAGNTDSELWDDADQLVALNLELRKGDWSVRAWPSHMFAMGRDDGGCANALDVTRPDATVWWTDRCNLDQALQSGSKPEAFTDWSARTLAAYRSDLEDEGIDPDGSPQARHAAYAALARGEGRCLMIFAGTAVFVALAVWAVVFMMSR